MTDPHLPAVVTPYTIPLPLMDVLQVTVLVLVAVGATAVVLIRDLRAGLRTAPPAMG